MSARFARPCTATAITGSSGTSWPRPATRAFPRMSVTTRTGGLPCIARTPPDSCGSGWSTRLRFAPARGRARPGPAGDVGRGRGRRERFRVHRLVLRDGRGRLERANPHAARMGIDRPHPSSRTSTRAPTSIDITCPHSQRGNFMRPSTPTDMRSKGTKPSPGKAGTLRVQ
jgi:hypothetical protein